MELSGLSADLDVLNELSCSLTLEDAAAQRLQFLNRGWADASARAEEACRSVRGGHGEMFPVVILIARERHTFFTCVQRAADRGAETAAI